MSLAITEVILSLAAVALVARLLFGNRPTAAHFLAVHGLAAQAGDVAAVTAALARVHRGRVVGGVVGVLAGGAGGAFLAARFTIGGAIVGLLAGTLVGIAFAQSPRRAPARAQRRASLVARRPSDYQSAPVERALLVLGMLVLGGAATVVVCANDGLGRYGLLVALALATLSAFPLGRRLERRTVELARDDAGAGLSVDDALRTTAVRAIQHATVGLLCCGLLAIGIAAVETQTFQGAEAGGHVLVRTSLGSHSLSVTPIGPLTASGARSRVRWTGSDGSAHEATITVPRTGVTIGSFVDNEIVLALGALTSIAALVAALVEWGRAARAWRRPTRNRGAVLGAPAIVAAT